MNSANQKRRNCKEDTGKIRETVLSHAQYEELSKLNQECWKESNPLENMIQINSLLTEYVLMKQIF